MKPIRVQVLELGTHHVKAVAGTSRPAGRFQIEAAGIEEMLISPVRLEDYLDRLGKRLDTLLLRTFQRRAPVHVIGGEWLVRSMAQVVPGVPESDVEVFMRNNLSHFVSSYGTREPVFRRSALTRTRSQEDRMELALVHSMVRASDLDRLSRSLEAPGFRLGMVLSPVMALQDLLLKVLSPDGRGGGDVRVVVDAGFSMSTVHVLDTGTIVSTRVSHSGALDLLERLRELDPDLAAREDRDLVRIVTGLGFQPTPERLASLDIAPEPADRITRLIEDAGPGYFRGLKQSIQATVRDRFTGEDGDDPAIERPLTGTVAFLGGFSGVPGFLDRAQKVMGVPVRGLDPLVPFEVGKELKDASSMALSATALGSLLVAASEEPGRGDLAEEYRGVLDQVRRQSTWALGGLTAGVILTGLGTFMVTLMITWLYGFHLEGEVARLVSETRQGRADLPGRKEVRQILAKIREAVFRQSLIRARVSHVESLVSRRPRVANLANAIHRAQPRAGCTVSRLKLTAKWTGPTGPSAGSSDAEKGFVAEIRGEAEEAVTVTRFAQDLAKSSLLARVRIEESQRAAGSPAGAGRSPYTYRITARVLAEDGSHE